MIYDIFRIIGLITGYPIQWLFFKRKTYYEDKKNTNLRKGGKLIITNHYNMFDYVLVSFMVFPRKLNAVASEMPFKNKLLKFGMKFFGIVEANRENKNMNFIDICASIIKDKRQLVQIYPEGRNTPDGKIHEFKRSYILIAHRAQAKIVPIVTDGNYGIFKRASVIVGKEIDIYQFIDKDKKVIGREDRERINAYIYNKVLELREKLEKLKNKKKVK